MALSNTLLAPGGRLSDHVSIEVYCLKNIENPQCKIRHEIKSLKASILDYARAEKVRGMQNSQTWNSYLDELLGRGSFQGKALIDHFTEEQIQECHKSEIRSLYVQSFIQTLLKESLDQLEKPDGLALLEGNKLNYDPLYDTPDRIWGAERRDDAEALVPLRRLHEIWLQVNPNDIKKISGVLAEGNPNRKSEVSDTIRKLSKSGRISLPLSQPRVPQKGRCAKSC